MQTKLTLPACLTKLPVINVKDKTVLYQQGDTLSRVWIVKQGFIKIHRLSLQGKQFTLSLLGKGCILGAVECQHVIANETATTQGTADVYQMNTHYFAVLLSEESDFSQFISFSFFRRKEALQHRLFYIMQRKVATRVAALLSDLAQNEGERCIHGGEIDIRLSQQDIADMIGASRQVVSSLLNTLRKQDIIHYSRNLICIIDLAAVITLAEN